MNWRPTYDAPCCPKSCACTTSRSSTSSRASSSASKRWCAGNTPPWVSSNRSRSSPSPKRSASSTNIDRFVLTEACAQARLWQSLGLAPPGLLMSVNLSAREISDSSIRESVSLSLLETGFEPTHLILEITESALLRDLDATIRNLESLKSLGLSIAVDDFGTGFSSFSHLEQLPIDILKVDRSFVANITVPDGRPSLAPAIVQLAHTLGLIAIAEGVESPDQVTPLRDLSADWPRAITSACRLDATETEGLLRSLAS